MRYLYYPGCSLRGTGRAYEESLLPVLEKLGVEFEELPDWNCCGATAYMAIDETKAFGLAARNIALAEDCGGHDLLTPCAACYLVLNKAKRYIAEYPELREKITHALAAVGLKYRNHVKVRHPLDVLVNDVGVERIKECTTRPLEGLKVACYYGCQIVRPFADFDDPYNPCTMETLMEALGAETVDWPLKTRCCGGSLTGTIEHVGQRTSYILLKEARRRGADAIATACPLCQFNLECYQDAIARRYDDPGHVPVAFFTQLMGLAMGIPPDDLGINRLFVPLAMPVTA